MLCDLVEKIPHTRVVLDHVGTPIGMGGPFGGFGETTAERAKIKQTWQDDMKRLAQSEQVYVKLSGLFMHPLGWHHLDSWQSPITAEQAADYMAEPINFVLETFGPDRCMFGSNFPPDLGLIDFVTLYDAFFKVTETLDWQTKQALFANNARKFYRLD